MVVLIADLQGRKPNMGMSSLTILLCLVLPFLSFSVTAKVQLSTDSRWIVDDYSGHRAKLACVNWPSHLEAVVAEGLSNRPVNQISQQIKTLGFNCVRLTWPLFLFTNDTLASLTVRQSLQNLGLAESISGFQENNPSILNLSLISAYQAVVGSLARNEVMVILDNHISKPGWCCSNTDGNGFFGDEYFKPEVWIKGLTRVSTTFKNTENVVAMSLRNELRGPKQNIDDWYRYMQKGAEAVHAANPNILVILSGLRYDRDLSFLANKPVSLTFKKKLVFEVHWYGFSDGQAWTTGNPNQVCGQVVSDIMNKAGFLLSQGYPLFVSEFGVDMRGINVNDNRYLNCFMGWAAEFDVDWALWALTGSYYLREGVFGHDEAYGVYDWNWCGIKNQTMLHKLSAIQYPFKGPGYAEASPHKLLFHPMTGFCVKRLSLLEPLVLAPCSEAEAWSYDDEKTLTIKGSYFCLQTDSIGRPAKLGLICKSLGSKWEAISDSKMHLSSKLKDGTDVCLEPDSSNKIVTNKCKCLDNRDNKCDPGSQWFKVIDSTRGRSHNTNTLLNEIKSVATFVMKTIPGEFSL